jgi:hypothetical protein
MYVYVLFQAQAEARQKGISDKSEAELQAEAQQRRALARDSASGDEESPQGSPTGILWVDGPAFFRPCDACQRCFVRSDAIQTLCDTCQVPNKIFCISTTSFVTFFLLLLPLASFLYPPPPTHTHTFPPPLLI